MTCLIIIGKCNYDELLLFYIHIDAIHILKLLHKLRNRSLQLCVDVIITKGKNYITIMYILYNTHISNKLSICKCLMR